MALFTGFKTNVTSLFDQKSIQTQIIIAFGLALTLLIFFTGKSNAASLANASDTVSTSRPSASTPLSANAAAGAGSLSVFNNASRYLASDSAKILDGSGVLVDNGIIVASQSAALTTVYLGNTLVTAAVAGETLINPITAMHTITFTPTTTIPSGGTIIITFPGAANNTASPSATTFAFNNLLIGNVKSNPTSGCAGGVVVGSPKITCTTNAVISAGTQVTVLIGCSAASGATCTTQVPSLINPTKGNTTAGQADVWKVGITTTDGTNNLDSSTVAIGTVESVTVRANVDPTLTFTITGLNNGTTLGTQFTGCTQADSTNAGINATATDVNLGTLSDPPSTNATLKNIAAQTLVVTTNGANGYVITATASGQLTNFATGFAIASATTPQAFPASTNFFGLHACGLDTNLTTWNTTASSTCNTYITGSTDPICKYAWPTQTTALTIASRATGPVGNVVVAGSGQNVVSYAGTQDVTVPPGIYQSVVTYVATPSF